MPKLGQKCPAISAGKIRHGDAIAGNKAPLYDVWAAMKQRCYNANDSHYESYGGRGISVCEEWKNDYVPFRAWAMLSGYGAGVEIDRINNDGDYEPGNCRFIPRVKNARNKTTSLMISAFGETKSATAWSEDARCAISARILRKRFHGGWHPEYAITTGPQVNQFHKGEK